MAVSPWFPMSIVPRDGTRFVYLRRITTIGVGKPPRFSFDILAVQRDRVSETSAGVWMSGNRSVADRDLTHGWWAHSVPVDPETGAITLPPDAHDSPFAKDTK